MNCVFLTGRLTADPQLRHTNGTVPIPVCTFTLAVDDDRGDKTDYPTIVCWRDTAIFVSKYMAKGRKIAVLGKLKTRNYEKDGIRRKFTEVIADRIEFADGRPAPKSEEPENIEAPIPEDELD